ncbi:hypothetical protein CGCF415_v015148 [Colletotrichum fructicola]|uniref:Uncharacterized protein n=1 Tax=Colletotrichum fructicola (strain Nara gc5) TaxID=1213859 RepID=A0A7J6ISZ4_COLFN|nr:uncharacterized protein CGMCC3_g3313 [Colletotrichum fructicola]KAF4479153.1 hypothetical protein CGGC5_v012671 [Colletotrichum fructicola Nara gc5]KAE9580592.1 hypothetical protein CGMCC3_g3313 [Colletotrichum fructicola]KAF4881633.1 hypothetical protein CGCFRS4_v015363 [Colletotrichum fructicola]KAF4886403.1 hypothetical protein CGCF415_v015148 [Colletotrichum fructicola]KAF4922420.1 hypothetical protein CGCF245_v015340 [Colletotrichum fructicola]
MRRRELVAQLEEPERFDKDVVHCRNISSLGNGVLLVLGITGLIVSSVSYTRGVTKTSVELAHCIVSSVFLPLLILATYFILSLKPGKSVLLRLIYVVVTISLYGIKSLVFGVLLAREISQAQGWSSQKMSLRHGPPIVSLVTVFAAAFAVYLLHALAYTLPDQSTPGLRGDPQPNVMRAEEKGVFSQRAQA